MKLKSITATNLKGQSFQHVLDGVDVFTGDSFSGKTARLIAVKLAVLGYDPRLGKLPTATFQLATGTRMTVDAEIDTGGKIPLVIGRQWRLENGKVKTKGVPTEADSFVAATALDLREYLKLTGAGRVQYVFDRFAPQADEGFGNRLVGAVKSIKVAEPSANTELALVEAARIASEYRDSAREENATAGQLLDAVAEQFKEQRDLAKSNVAQMSGLIQGQEAVQTQEADAEPLRSVEPEIKIESDELDSWNEKLTQARSHNWMADDVAGRLGKLREQIKQAGAPDPDALEKLRQKLAGLEPLPNVSKNLNHAHSVRLELRNTQKQMRSEAERLRREAGDLEVEWNYKRKMKCCPTCKAKGKGWLDELEKEFTSKIADRNKSATECLLKAELAGKELVTAEAVYQQSEEIARKFEQAENERVALQQEINRMQQQSLTVESLRGRIAELEKQMTPKVETEPLEQKVNFHAAELLKLRSRHDQYVAAQQARNNRLKAMAQRDQHEAAVKVFKAAVEMIREIKEKMVNDTIGNLMGRVRQFTDGILKGEMEYRDGELGYADGAQWVSHEVFSGTETALAYTGFAVTLAVESKLRLVLIDELGIMDPRTKRLVVERMRKLVDAGTLDNFIGADSNSDSWPNASKVFKLHEVKGNKR